MSLNELTWLATYTYNGVIGGITTDPVLPAHIITGDGLWKTKVYDQVSKEMGMTNEPGVPEPTSNTTYSHDYTFRLAREGGAVCLKVIESPLVP